MISEVKAPHAQQKRIIQNNQILTHREKARTNQPTVCKQFRHVTYVFIKFDTVFSPDFQLIFGCHFNTLYIFHGTCIESIIKRENKYTKLTFGYYAPHMCLIYMYVHLYLSFFFSRAHFFRDFFFHKQSQ